MTHYLCKGKNCKTVSERPSVCLEPSCANRYKLLEDCNCPHKSSHFENNECISNNSRRINVVNLGVAVGATAGLFTLFFGLFASITGSASDLVRALSEIYIGYDTTLIGSFAGALWAFVDGYIGGVIIASLYNWMSKIRT
jgi:hypothetical protein